MDFNEIRERAIARWQALHDSGRVRILIGTATCGIAAGAENILNSFRRELERHGLQAEIGAPLGVQEDGPQLDRVGPHVAKPDVLGQGVPGEDLS
ncbi:MAG: hypothetical protein N2506_05540, partial [Dehalococcoidales bacterium]|nr:hypothetical protein [Dehalococcoidales bacterium]